MRGRRGLRPVPAEPAAARAVSRAALGRRLRLPWPGLRPGQAALRAARAAQETARGPAESCAFGRAPRRPLCALNAPSMHINKEKKGACLKEK